MFVDSHCHLNYKGLAEDQAGVLERARAAGVDTMLNISTRAARMGRRHRRRRARARRLGLGRDPPARGRRPSRRRDRDPGRARRRIRASSRSARAGSIIITIIQRPRAAARQLPRPYRRRARDRPAAHRPHPRRRGGHGRDPRRGDGEGGLYGRHPLLHRTPDFARQALDLGLYISISGIVTFKNASDLQETAQRAAGRAAADRDRLARSSPRSRIAASPASRPSSPTRRASSPLFASEPVERLPRPPAPISAPCSPRRPDEGPDPRLRHLVRSAAGRQRLGRMRSGRAAQPPAAGLDPGRHAARPGSWSTPAPTFASNCSTPK